MTRLEAVARVIAVAFWLLTSLFAWLISVPFAYQNFIKPRLLPDFIAFAEYHGYLAAALWPVGWLALHSALADSRSRGVLTGWEPVLLRAMSTITPPASRRLRARPARCH